MQRLLTVLKTVFLVGILVTFTAACSPATTAKSMDEPSLPGQVQPYQGGMNNFRDVPDDRLNTTGADAKAQALKDSVKRNINTNRVNDVDDLVDNVRSADPGKQVSQVAKDVRRGAEDLKDDLKDSTNKGANTLKRNLDNTSDAIDRTATKAKQDAKSVGDSMARQVERTGAEVDRNFKATADSVAKTAEKAKDNLSENPIKRTGAYIQDKVEQAGNAINDVTDNVIENTKQAIDKAA